MFLCLSVPLSSSVCIVWINEHKGYERRLNVVCLCALMGLIFLYLTQTLQDGEEIFNQRDSVCWRLNGLMQVNLNPYKYS